MDLAGQPRPEARLVGWLEPVGSPPSWPGTFLRPGFPVCEVWGPCGTHAALGRPRRGCSPGLISPRASLTPAFCWNRPHLQPGTLCLSGRILRLAPRWGSSRGKDAWVWRETVRPPCLGSCVPARLCTCPHHRPHASDPTASSKSLSDCLAPGPRGGHALP